jgi:hypothetical protein
MRLATFVRVRGDTASAKRMFDAVLALYTVILSHDFVWPLSDEIEAQADASVEFHF